MASIKQMAAGWAEGQEGSARAKEVKDPRQPNRCSARNRQGGSTRDEKEAVCCNGCNGIWGDGRRACPCGVSVRRRDKGRDPYEQRERPECQDKAPAEV